MNIPLGKPYIKPDVAFSEIKKVIDSRWISGGPAIDRFEQAIKEYNNDETGYYVAVSNCTVALELSLLAINNWECYTKDQEVIVPSWSWVASAFAINHVGATPVFCDVNEFGVPDINTIEHHITPSTKAIMIVHQMGIPCDIDEINKLAKKYDLKIVEDAACALGSEYKGKKIGVSENLVCYSFQARKVLTTGEGGMIVTRDKTVANKLKSMRAFGTNVSPLMRDASNKLHKESFSSIGFNYKISDLQCALGLAHLSYLDEEIDKRSKIAKYYNKRIKEIFSTEFQEDDNDDCCDYDIELKLFDYPEYCTRYNYQNYHILLYPKQCFPNWLCKYRDSIISTLKNKGIGCKWDIQAIHIEPAYKNKYQRCTYSMDTTMDFHNGGIWLPFYAEMTSDEQDVVLDALVEAFDNNKKYKQQNIKYFSKK